MAGWMAEHRKARMICPQGPCEVCSAPDAEVHHKNEDWKDHGPENLQRLRWLFTDPEKLKSDLAAHGIAL